MEALVVAWVTVGLVLVGLVKAMDALGLLQ